MSGHDFAPSDRMLINNLDAERKLVVIQEYLVKNFPQSTVHCDEMTKGESVLVLMSDGTIKSTIRVSSTLLSDRHPTAMELGWALEDNHLAEKIAKTSQFCLDHEAVPERL